MELETTTQKAAKVRADVKAALKARTLGQLPDGLKISVRTEYASCMSAINITLRGVSDEWALTEPEMDQGYPTRHITAECKALAVKLLEIVDRHFARDGRSHFADVSLESGLMVAV